MMKCTLFTCKNNKIASKKQEFYFWLFNFQFCNLNQKFYFPTWVSLLLILSFQQFIKFSKNFHPTCLFGTTRLFGTLEDKGGRIKRWNSIFLSAKSRRIWLNFAESCQISQNLAECHRIWPNPQQDNPFLMEKLSRNSYWVQI